MPVLSGSANAGSPFDVRADRPAAESAYAALVGLVEQAQVHRAPFVRMADRYAGFFLPATLIAAALAWAISGDPSAPGGRRGRHALPADPGRADRARLRPLARGPLRRDRQGRGRDRDARRSAHRPVRQDRHAHGRNARCSRHRHVWRSDPGELLALAASVDQMSAHVLGEALVRPRSRPASRLSPDRCP